MKHLTQFYWLAFFFGATVSFADMPSTRCELSLTETVSQILSPVAPLPFDGLNWHGALSVSQATLVQLEKQVDQLLENSAPASFGNTFMAFDRLREQFNILERLMGPYSSVMPSEENSKAEALVKTQLLELRNRLYFNEKFIQRLNQVRASDLADLKPGDRDLIEMLSVEFSEKGAFFSPEKKERLMKLQQEEMSLMLEFSEKLKKASKAFSISGTELGELEGLPADMITAAMTAGAEATPPKAWLIQFSGPNYLTVLRLAKSHQLRKKMFNGGRRLSPNAGFYFAETQMLSNEDVGTLRLARRIAVVRQKLARLFGFKNFAEMKTKKLMAKTPKTAREFLQRLIAKELPQAKADWAELQAAARADGIDELKGWDVPYYVQQTLEKKYKFNEAQLRPYMRLDQLFPRTLEVLGKTFHFDRVRSESLSVYDPSVLAYEVRNANADKNSKPLGFLYMDFFSRPGKPGGFIEQVKSKYAVGSEVSSAVVMYNASYRPNPEAPEKATWEQLAKGVYSSLDEYRTTVHELGHTDNAMASGAEHASQGSINGVKMDIVEFPSKFFENFLSDPQFMKQVARHEVTDESIPDELLQAIQQTRKHMYSLAAVARASYGLLDLAWHENPAFLDESRSIEDLENEVIGPYRFYAPQPGSTLSSTYHHIFNGQDYASVFYGYQWSEEHGFESFPVFAAEGSTSPEAGARFRKQILERQDMPEGYQEYMGR